MLFFCAVHTGGFFCAHFCPDRADTPGPEFVGISREGGARSPRCGPRDAQPPSRIENDAPPYRKRRTSSEQSAKGPGGRLRQSKAGKCGPAALRQSKAAKPPRPATSPEQSGKARARRLLQSKARKPTAPVGLRQSKARKPTAPLGLRQSKAEKRRPATFPEQSAKVWLAGASPEQSGKARARRLSQSKA